MSLVSFIIVNWNGCSFISSCIDSILNQTYKNFEIIIVDNGSIDGSVNFFKKQYPEVKIVKLKKNYGFATGNNIGFKESSGKYIALVNNDAVLDKFWLENMVNTIETSKKTGFCSSKIIINNTDEIDSIGDRFTTAFTGTKVGEYQSPENFFKPMQMHGVCAAAALYKREMIKDIGFFHDIFFLNHEDTDLNMRAWLSGWKCYFTPDAVAYHDVNRSIGTLSDTSVYHFSRNNIWVWLINVPSFFLIRNIPQRILYEIFAGFYFCFIHKKWKPYIKGKADVFKYFGKILKKRKKVQKKIRLSKEQICCDLKPIHTYLLERISIK